MVCLPLHWLEPNVLHEWEQEKLKIVCTERWYAKVSAVSSLKKAQLIVSLMERLFIVTFTV